MRQEPQVSTSASSQIHLDFNIGGMHCAACARRIERKVGTLDGIEQAAVNLATERLRVSISPQPVLGDSVTATSTSAVSDTPANDINIGDLNSSIINAVEAAGFSAQPQTQIQPQTQPTDPDRTTISIDGMHCAA